MKRWENNILIHAKTGKSGRCPDCGSENVLVEEFKRERHCSISFLCKDCKSSDHFDGFLPEYDNDKPLSNDIREGQNGYMMSSDELFFFNEKPAALPLYEDIALCHAIGQACAVVHTAGHAMGYPMYELSSIVYRLGIENCLDAVEQRKQEYIQKLFHWSEHVGDYEGEWADFMLK